MHPMIVPWYRFLKNAEWRIIASATMRRWWLIFTLACAAGIGALFLYVRYVYVGQSNLGLLVFIGAMMVASMFYIWTKANVMLYLERVQSRDLQQMSNDTGEPVTTYLTGEWAPRSYRKSYKARRN
jgi:hypothetical protein